MKGKVKLGLTNSRQENIGNRMEVKFERPYAAGK